MRLTLGAVAAVLLGLTAVVRTDGATVEITVDTSAAPEMADFAANCKEAGEKYYPTISDLLPSDGYTPPNMATLTFVGPKNGEEHYVAYTIGVDIFCDPDYYTKHLDDVGSIIHELAHVVQQYTVGTPPGWLIEGIADWVRWFNYEPVDKRPQIKYSNEVSYDMSYQVTASFLFWASETYDPKLVQKLNDACRRGNYTDQIWKDSTGKTVQVLGDEWKAQLPN